MVARWRAAVPDYPAGAVLGFLMPVILYSATAILKPALIVPPLIRCAFSAVASSKYTAYRLVSVTPSRGFRPCPGFLVFLGIRAVSSYVIGKYGPIFNKCQQSTLISFQRPAQLPTKLKSSCVSKAKKNWTGNPGRIPQG